MKLWVDDIRNAPDDSWTVARTVTSAIECMHIFGDSITEVSLDHDISYQVEVLGTSRPYPSPETFRAVAHYILERYRPDMHPNPPKITIHSANPVGSKAMVELLSANMPEVNYKPMGAANRLEMEA